jgi:hypothetical protein
LLPSDPPLPPNPPPPPPPPPPPSGDNPKNRGRGEKSVPIVLDCWLVLLLLEPAESPPLDLAAECMPLLLRE